jgi:cobalt-precorrin-7 (C5)-methyltransferase
MAVVLSTGDPMLSGLGYLPGRVVPGISSLQVACARLKISLLKVVPVTVHGRSLDPEPIASELRKGKCVFLLTDENTDLTGLCSHLESLGLKGDVAVLTDLGYPEERIVLGGTEAPPRAPGLSCVMIGQFR